MQIARIGKVGTSLMSWHAFYFHETHINLWCPGNDAPWRVQCPLYLNTLIRIWQMRIHKPPDRLGRPPNCRWILGQPPDPPPKLFYFSNIIQTAFWHVSSGVSRFITLCLHHNSSENLNCGSVAVFVSKNFSPSGPKSLPTLTHTHFWRYQN